MNIIGQDEGDGWMAYHGDCVPVLRAMPDDSIHFSVFSPPYLCIYVYSSSERDLGNCGTDEG